MTHSNAQAVTLNKKKAELRVFLKLIVTLWKRGKISRVRLVICRPSQFC